MPKRSVAGGERSRPARLCAGTNPNDARLKQRLRHEVQPRFHPVGARTSGARLETVWSETMMAHLKVVAISLPLLIAGFGAVSAAETPASKASSIESKVPSDKCETDQGTSASRTTEGAVSKTASAADATGRESSGSVSISSDDRGKTPTEIVKDIVDNPKPSEGGQMVAETGRARPVESWFGCPPK